MNRDLSKGPVVRSMLLFAIPMILGDLLQQCYNIADTLIVGQFLGEKALAAVGSSFTLMTFITSILLGLCMGSGALFSIRFGQRDENGLKEDICASFFFIAAVTLLLNMVAYVSLDGLRSFLRVPDEVWGDMRAYLFVIFMGIPAVFLYNYFTSYLRAIGNSVVPLVFLALSSVLNIILDLWFVIGLELGVSGAAQATVLSQYLSGLGIMLYTLVNHKQVRAIRKIGCLKKERIREILSFSMLTCIQQSVMNLGILMVQGLVNSFGTVIMAAFAAAVKIDAFAYMPVQDFGNAFSTFIAQNYGAKEKKRIQQGLKAAVRISAIFCVIAKIKSPYPADWSRICSNSDCPESSVPDPPPVPAVSLPVSTSLASSNTRTVSYWSSARYPPSCAKANLKNPLVITPKMKFLNVFSNPLDSRTVTSSAPIRSSIAIPSDVPYNLDSIEYGLEKQERRSISLAYASLVSFPDFPAPTN